MCSVLNDAHTTSLYNSITGSIIFPIIQTKISGDIGVINTINRMRNRNSVVLLFRGYFFLNNVTIHYRPFERSPDDLRVQKSLRLRIKFLTVLNLIIQFWILSPCVSALSRYAQSVSAFLYFSAFPVPPGAIALHHLPVWFLFLPQRASSQTAPQPHRRFYSGPDALFRQPGQRRDGNMVFPMVHKEN
ncbi:Uncharacterised protein [Shigella sonnei]|nr:Uncharacterised protein [Shigella sonnei]